MKKIEITCVFTEYNESESMDLSIRTLIDRAFQMCTKAYAPYSMYRVGCAVELNNGEIITGSNQENMAYPSGLCAERVAVYAAMSNFPEATIKRIAISTAGDQPIPAAPCGSCRQVMLEYELNQGFEIELILGNPTGKVRVIQGIKKLLPLYFFEESLKKSKN